MSDAAGLAIAAALLATGGAPSWSAWLVGAAAAFSYLRRQGPPRLRRQGPPHGFPPPTGLEDE